jgi:hypothetical protein
LDKVTIQDKLKDLPVAVAVGLVRQAELLQAMLRAVAAQEIQVMRVGRKQHLRVQAMLMLAAGVEAD